LRPKDIAVFVEYERKLNDYLDALLPSNDAIQILLSGKALKMSIKDRDMVEDISISYQQMTNRCKSLLRTITNLRDSYRAVMDTRLNETIRLLTVITLALAIPTMLAGLYGMNVELPGHEQSPATFWVIAIFSIGTSAVMMFYFLYKRR
jgi:magnesium transporter